MLRGSRSTHGRLGWAWSSPAVPSSEALSTTSVRCGRFWAASASRQEVMCPAPRAPPRPPAGRTLSVTVHDTVPWTHPETLTARGVSWHRSMIARAAKRASGLVVPTRAVADELAVLVEVDVPVRVVPHGVTVPAGKSDLDLPQNYVL